MPSTLRALSGNPCPRSPNAATAQPILFVSPSTGFRRIGARFAPSGCLNRAQFPAFFRGRYAPAHFSRVKGTHVTDVITGLRRDLEGRLKDIESELAAHEP